MSTGSRGSGTSALIAAQVGFVSTHMELVSAQRAFISPQLELFLPQLGYVLHHCGPVSCRSVLAQLLFICTYLENVCTLNLSLLAHVESVFAQLGPVLA